MGANAYPPYPPHPRNNYLRTSPTPTSATINAVGFSTALVMFNEAQAGNRAIENLQAGVTEGAPDEEMANEFATQNEDTAEAANIIGGRSTIRQLLLFLIQQAIANPITEFHRVHKTNDESRRIATAITPQQLSDAAQRIAAVVQAERPAARPVLCGLIREQADKSIEDMRKRLQSLEAKAAKDDGKNRGRPTSQKNASGDGKKTTNKTTPKSTPKTTPKSILRTPGNAAAEKTPKKKLPKKDKSPSDNHFAALADDSNDTADDKKPRARNRQRSSSKSRKSDGSTDKAN